MFPLVMPVRGVQVVGRVGVIRRIKGSEVIAYRAVASLNPLAVWDRLSGTLKRRALAQLASALRQREQNIRIPRAVQAKRFIQLQIARPDIETRRMHAQQ